MSLFDILGVNVYFMVDWYKIVGVNVDFYLFFIPVLGFGVAVDIICHGFGLYAFLKSTP